PNIAGPERLHMDGIFADKELSKSQHGASFLFSLGCASRARANFGRCRFTSRELARRRLTTNSGGRGTDWRRAAFFVLAREENVRSTIATSIASDGAFTTDSTGRCWLVSGDRSVRRHHRGKPADQLLASLFRRDSETCQLCKRSQSRLRSGRRNFCDYRIGAEICPRNNFAI